MSQMAKKNVKPSGTGPLEKSIPQLQQAMEKGELSATSLVRFYLDRIEKLDKSGPKLNSVLETNPDALEIAKQLDMERKTTGPRGPLHGIPILLKDNIATADKLHTSAGSLAMAKSRAPRDAFLVERLRAAGAVILGKTNMTEWANFMTTGMKNGYSSRGGQVLNPHNPAFDTGGSSSGSGVSVAANLCAAAVGTETSGSILSPANQNGVVGIKPTVGLISRSGVIPISATQDTAGPMARSVTDAAVLLGAMTGIDPKDPATRASRGKFHTDYTQFLREDSLKGARIGIPRAYFYERPSKEELEVVERAIKTLGKLGAEVIDPANIPTAKEVGELRYEVLLYEFKRDLNKYFKWLGPKTPIKSLKDLIRYNEDHPGQMLRYGQTLLLAAEAASGVDSKTYRYHRAKDLRLVKTEGLDAAFKKYKLDALLFPMYWGAAIGAKAGYPSICVPAGYTKKGQPVGITFLGKAWSEQRLVSLAYCYETSLKP